MTLPEARKALKRVGTSRATGAALCAMYADLVVLSCCLGKPHTVAVYHALQKCEDDDAIAEQSRAWMRDPLSVFDVL